MNEVYFIGGPLDLTKRMLNKVGSTIKVYERGPYSALSNEETIESKIIEYEYRVREIQPAPNGNRRFIALIP